MNKQTPKLVTERPLSTSNTEDTKRSVNAKLAAMGSLKFIVYAIRKALETMPQPWEAVKQVNVAHQKGGSFTFILSKSRTSDNELLGHWAEVCRNVPSSSRPPNYPIFDGSTPYLSYANNLAFIRPPPFSHTPKGHRQHQLSNGHAGVDRTLGVKVCAAKRALRNCDTFAAERLVPSIFTHLSRSWSGDTFLSRNNIYLCHPLTEEQVLAYPSLYYPHVIGSSRMLPVFPASSPSSFCDTVVDRAKKNLMHIDTARMLSCLGQRNARNDAAQFTLQNRTLSVPQLQSKFFCALACSTHGESKRNRSIATILRQSSQFDLIYNVDWLEAAQALLIQAHDAINLMIHRKNVTFFSLDYNFNLTHTKVLSTKERKQSRFGKAFHLVRELMKFFKYVVDTHIAYRLLLIDYPAFVMGTYHLFTNIGTVTSIYRYKYKVSRQIKQIKALHTLCNGLPLYHPAQCVMNNYLRGVSPLLEAYMGMLLARTAGLVEKNVKKVYRRITGQRALTNQVLEQRIKYRERFMALYPQFTVKSASVKLFLAHLSEAWHCWRAGISYDTVYAEMADDIAGLVRQYVQERADLCLASMAYVKERLARNKWIAKTEFYKYCGRAGRQDMRNLIASNAAYLHEPLSAALVTSLGASHALSYICINTVRYMFGSVPVISFPLQNFEYDNKILELALKSLQDETVMKTVLTVADRQMLSHIEKAFTLPQEFLIKVKNTLLKQRTFETVKVEYCEVRDRVYPLYSSPGLTQIVDTYLAQYISHQVSARPCYYLLFVRGFTSIDLANPYSIELPAELAFRYCRHVHATCTRSKCRSTATCHLVHLHIDTAKYFRSINLILARKVLSLLFDPILCSFIISRLSSSFCFKDMTYTATIGITPAFHFSHFLATFFLSLLDLSILLQYGDRDIAPDDASRLLSFIQFFVRTYAVTRQPLAQLWARKAFLDRDVDLATQSLKLGDLDLQSYVRVGESIYIILRDTHSAVQPGSTILAKDILPHIPSSLHEFITTRSEACDSGAFYSLPLHDSFIKFEFANYIISAKKLSLLFQEDGILASVTDNAINDFVYCANQIILASTSTSFAKTIAKWNSLLLNYVLYYREALLRTPRLLRIITSYEEKICSKVKQGLNSQMPNRFPNVVFYSSREIGGLGMLSIGTLRIFEEDSEPDPKYPVAERAHRWDQRQQDILLPSILHFVTPWGQAIPQSVAAFRNLLALFCRIDSERPHHLSVENEPHGFHIHEYSAREDRQVLQPSEIHDYLTKEGAKFNIGSFREAVFQTLSQAFKSTQVFDESQASWKDVHIPRISTLVHYVKDLPCMSIRNSLLHHLSKRVSITTAMTLKTWYNRRIVGLLYDLQGYHRVMALTFGGTEEILRHTLFPIINCDDYKAISWIGTTEHETGLAQRTSLTKARRQGLSQIPNRRFALWWSPTINRSSVYIGYRTQIDLMGVYMCGKLSTLKTAYVSLFRGHIWSMIHSSLVKALSTILLETFQGLPFTSITTETVHPRKSYHYHTSCGDIAVVWSHYLPILRGFTIYIPGKWAKNVHGSNSTNETLPAEEVYVSPGEQTDNTTRIWWLDLHLSWGNIDTASSLAQYAKERHAYYISDRSRGIYRSKHGVIVCLDLLYRSMAIHGSVPTLASTYIQKAAVELSASLKTNVMLALLCDRARTQLGMNVTTASRLTDITTVSFGDLFTGKTLIIDDSFAYTVKMQQRDDHTMSRNIINGSILLLSPETGRLIVSVVHAGTYAGQSRRAALSRWRTADLLMAYIASLPESARPHTLVVCNRASIDPIKTLVSNFTPPINVCGTHLHWSLSSVRHLLVCTQGNKGPIKGTLDEVIQLQTSSTSLVVDLYAQFREADKYTGLIQEGTAIQHFIALLLILRVTEASPMFVYNLIAQTAFTTNPPPFFPSEIYRDLFSSRDSAHAVERLLDVERLSEFSLLLPSVAYSNWSSVITKMTEKVISNAAKKLGLTPDCLSPAEKRDLVLGADLVIINAPERKESIFAKTVYTTNVLGEQMLSVTQAKEVVDPVADVNSKMMQRRVQLKAIRRNPLFQEVFLSEEGHQTESSASYMHIIERVIGKDIGTDVDAYIVIGETEVLVDALVHIHLQVQAPIALIFGLRHRIQISGKCRSVMEVHEARFHSEVLDLFSCSSFSKVAAARTIQCIQEETRLKCHGFLVDFSHIGSLSQEMLQDGSLQRAILGAVTLLDEVDSTLILLCFYGKGLDDKPVFRAYSVARNSGDQSLDNCVVNRLRVHTAASYKLETTYLDPVQDREEPCSIDQNILYHTCTRFTNLFTARALDWEDL